EPGTSDPVVPAQKQEDNTFPTNSYSTPEQSQVISQPPAPPEPEQQTQATPPPPTQAPGEPPEPQEPVAQSQCTEGQVNINTASIEELQEIIHIGPARAPETVNLRPFTSVDDMDRIPGIGPSRLADIKAQGIACV
ncbi:MAG: competence protein ComEC, partial [Parcubacteria group bacterium Gr01-1014_107]